MTPWRLPGPARWLDQALSALYRDRVLLLHAPHAPWSLADALVERLGEEALFTATRLTLQPGQAFLPALAEAAALEVVSVAALATASELRHAAIVLSVAEPADAGLTTFARLIRRPGGGQPPLLAIVSADGALRLDGVAVTPVRDAFEPLDGAAYAAALPRTERSRESGLVASIATEVAGWDVGLIEALAALPVARAVRPDLCVPDWDAGRSLSWRGRPLRWELGTLDGWGEESVAHPAWQAANAPERLRKRVWRGQLRSLLPWIEQRRQLVIALERRRLRADERSGPDVALLDWGPLAYQLAGSAPWLTTLLRSFREARNELAHGRPIDWPLIHTCREADRRLQAKLAAPPAAPPSAKA